MSDHVILCVDHFVNPKPLQSFQVTDSVGEGSAAQSSKLKSSIADDTGMDILSDEEEEQPLLQSLECRICQEEDNIHNLEVPCACRGSLKFAHRKCVQRWCDEKGNIMCEICQQAFHPNYTAPSPRLDDTTIDISRLITGASLDINDPRVVAMAAAERYFLEGEYDEYADSNASGAAFCRSAALILLALLLLRHTLSINASDGDDDDASTFFSLFLLRAAGFLLPCYIMAWAISVLQRRRQQQEAALAAREVAFMLQAGQHRGLQFTMAPAPAVPPHQDSPSVVPPQSDNHNQFMTIYPPVMGHH